MKKIITLFKKDANDLGRVINEVNLENQWVFDGKGMPTRKFDGTACAIIDGVLYKRYDVKKGRSVPYGSISCQEPDKFTGHWPHWVFCNPENKADKYHFEALGNMNPLYDGTYELCGPKVKGNPEKFDRHVLLRHGWLTLKITDLSFEGIKKYLSEVDIEGIVFHEIGGDRMCKIRKSDFGIKRKMTTFVIVSFGDKYLKYRDALVRSINENMPGSRIKDIELDPMKSIDHHLANHVKLIHWMDNIEGNTVLIDADTIVLSDISEVFDLPGDLIYTKRFNNRTIPFNCGVVFVKGESGKRIVDQWCELDLKMFTDRVFHAKWKQKYYGFNQASFGCMLESMPELNIKHVPSSIYNSCDPVDWLNNYEKAKIVHVKSTLRTSIEKNRNQYRNIESRIKKYYGS